MAQITDTKFIGDGVIVNADVNASAAIARTKLASGTADHVVINNGSGVMSSEAQLSISRGGTGQSTATAAFDALAPTTTKGDLIAHDGSDNIRVSVGTNGNFLKADSSVAAGVTWSVTSNTFGVRSITTTDTLSASTDDVAILSGASFTLNLPTAVGNSGKRFVIKHNGTSLTQVYTIDGSGSETIDGTTTYALYTNGESLTIVSDGSNWILLDHFAETTWASDGTITITATTTNPTKPTGIVVDRLLWRRNGKNLEGRLEYKQSNTTSGAIGSGDYLFRIVPTALTVDTSFVTAYTTVEGSGYWQGVTNTIGSCMTPGSVASAVDGVGSLVLYDSTRARFFITNDTSPGVVSSAYGDILTSANHSYTAWFSVPIAEFRA